MPGEAVAAERAVDVRMNRRAIALRTLTRNCERMSQQRALSRERMRAFFARMNAGAYNGKRNCRITKEFDGRKGKSEGDRGEKKAKCVCLSPEGYPKQDKEVFLKKSDKITFFKADFFTHIIL